MFRKNLNLAFALALVLGVTGLASAQDGSWRRNRDHDRDDDRPYANGQYNRSSEQAYRDGYAQGQSDRSNNSRRNARSRMGRMNSDRAYRDAYQRGYNEGYNNSYRNDPYRNDPYRNDPYGRNVPYGRDRRDDPYYGNYPNGNYPNGNNYPYGGANSTYGRQVADVGYRDGLNDGQKDLMTGHSYRPTEGSNYKHADRGYNSSYGNKDSYKQVYRSGYLQGYQQGYRR
jgi:hypothetical protein